MAKRLLTFTFPATELFAWGGEPILRNRRPVGELSSVGYSARLERMVGMGFVHLEGMSEDVAGSYEIEISGMKVPAQASLKAPLA
jgi:glycine cleavage system aminomethyltransferase T